MQNIPNSGQRTVRANMKVKSFVSPKNPSQEEIDKFDSEVNAFLSSIDNKSRFLNGRNAYSIGEKTYVLVWYLERLPEETVTTPFGNKVKPVTAVQDEPTNNPTKEA